MQHSPLPSEPAPSDVGPGLDLFAAAWLEQWKDAGGFVTAVSAAMPGGIGYPMKRPQNAADGTYSNEAWHGKMRGMIELLDAVPLGREAVALHLQAHAIDLYGG